MAKRKFWLGMLVMALVFGMAVVSCDNSTTNDEGRGYTILSMLNLSTVAPDPAALAAVGLDQFMFNIIRDAAGGGFQGWVVYDGDVIVDDGDFLMVWTGRNETNFNNVAHNLDVLLGEDGRFFLYPGIHRATGYFSPYYYQLLFYSVRLSEDGYYVPAGLMIAIFRVSI